MSTSRSATPTTTAAESDGPIRFTQQSKKRPSLSFVAADCDLSSPSKRRTPTPLGWEEPSLPVPALFADRKWDASSLAHCTTTDTAATAARGKTDEAPTSSAVETAAATAHNNNSNDNSKRNDTLVGAGGHGPDPNSETMEGDTSQRRRSVRLRTKKEAEATAAAAAAAARPPTPAGNNNKQQQQQQQQTMYIFLGDKVDDDKYPGNVAMLEVIGGDLEQVRSAAGDRSRLESIAKEVLDRVSREIGNVEYFHYGFNPEAKDVRMTPLTQVKAIPYFLSKLEKLAAAPTAKKPALSLAKKKKPTGKKTKQQSAAAGKSKVAPKSQKAKAAPKAVKDGAPKIKATTADVQSAAGKKGTAKTAVRVKSQKKPCDKKGVKSGALEEDGCDKSDYDTTAVPAPPIIRRPSDGERIEALKTLKRDDVDGAFTLIRIPPFRFSEGPPAAEANSNDGFFGQKDECAAAGASFWNHQFLDPNEEASIAMVHGAQEFQQEDLHYQQQLDDIAPRHNLSADAGHDVYPPPPPPPQQQQQELEDYAASTTQDHLFTENGSGCSDHQQYQQKLEDDKAGAVHGDSPSRGEDVRLLGRQMSGLSLIDTDEEEDFNEPLEELEQFLTESGFGPTESSILFPQQQSHVAPCEDASEFMNLKHSAEADSESGGVPPNPNPLVECGSSVSNVPLPMTKLEPRSSSSNFSVSLHHLPLLSPATSLGSRDGAQPYGGHY